MSAIIYDGIVLDRAKVRVQRKTVMSGPSYVQTLWTLHVIGVYNPGYTAYTTVTGRPATSGVSPSLKPGGQPGKGSEVQANVLEALARPPFNVPPLAVAGVNRPIDAGFGGDAAALAQSIASQVGSTTTPLTAIIRAPVRAPQTDVAIRHALMQPRKRLTFIIGTDVVVDTPVPPFTVDVDNGPTPISCDVVEINGLKTFLVEYVISCATNEVEKTNTGKLTTSGIVPAVASQRSPYKVSPLLLHEYTMEHDLDQDLHCTRTITGRMVFRSDVLAKERLLPDQLRYWAGHPVPLRFNRQRVKVRALPDNRTLEYTVVDRQTFSPIDPNLMTRFEAVYVREVRHAGVEQLLGMANMFTGMVTRNSRPAAAVAAVAVAALPAAAIVDPTLLQTIGGGLSPLLTGGVSHLAGIPVTNHHATVRVWGHPDAHLSTLATAAEDTLNGILQFRNVTAGQLLAVPNGPDLLFGAKISRVTQDYTGRFLEYHVDFFGSLFLGFLALARPQLNNEPPEFNRNVGTIPEDWMRGPYLGACLTRALRDNGDDWDQVQDPPIVNDTEVVRGRNFLRSGARINFAGLRSLGQTVSGVNNP
jgi:hypothetical protein